MFAIHDLRHTYDGTEVLHVASWEVAQGSQWLVLGPSGSGKTTLLHILAGILKPSAGRVSVAGQDVGALSANELDRFRGRNIGLVLQRLHLMASLTVIHNLLLAQYLAALPQDTAGARAVLAGLGLAERSHAYPHELSFGQAQRVAVARAVVNRPKLLLADEPTSNLDDMRCLQALELLQTQASACNATLVIATHDQRIKARMPNQYAIGSAHASA